MRRSTGEPGTSSSRSRTDGSTFCSAGPSLERGRDNRVFASGQLGGTERPLHDRPRRDARAAQLDHDRGGAAPPHRRFRHRPLLRRLAGNRVPHRDGIAAARRGEARRPSGPTDALARRPRLVRSVVARCGVAPDLPILIAFRIQQAVAGALIFPNGIALLRATAPPGGWAAGSGS